MDTSHDPTHDLTRALRPARLLEAEQPALASHVTPPARLSVFVCCCLSPWRRECWGGRQTGGTWP